MFDDDLTQVITRVLYNEGAGPGTSIHSWRCEHPDRYGPCRCVESVASEITEQIMKLLDEEPY